MVALYAGMAVTVCKQHSKLAHPTLAQLHREQQWSSEQETEKREGAVLPRTVVNQRIKKTFLYMFHSSYVSLHIPNGNLRG